MSTWKVYWALFALSLAVMVSPFITLPYIPLTDMPDHVARLRMLTAYNSVPAFRELLQPAPQLVPNMALDLFGLLTVPFLGAILAAKAFLVLLMLLFALGCHLTASAMSVLQANDSAAQPDSPNWLVLPTLFVIYNTMLLYGFINYLMGVALYLIIFGAWAPLRHRFSWVGAAGFSVLTGSLWLFHLAPFAALCATMGLVLIADFVRCRLLPPKTIASLALGALAPGLYMLLHPSRLGGPTAFATFFDNVKRLLIFFVTPHRALDVACAALAAALLAAAYFLGKPRVSVIGLFLATPFLVAFFILPSFARGGADVNTRFLLLAVILALLSLRFELPTHTGGLLLGLALVLQITRVELLAARWRTESRIVAAQVSTLAILPRTSRILDLVWDGEASGRGRELRYGYRLASYATVSSDCVVSGTNLVQGAFPIEQRSAPLRVSTAGSPQGQDWAGIERHYAYLWAFNPPAAWSSFLHARYQRIGGSGLFSLFKLRQNP